MKNHLYFLLVLFSALTLASCGSSSDDDGLSGTYSVNDINILADDIGIGEEVRVEVFFETKTESDGVPDGVDVVVRIPAELAYVPGTSQIYDGGLGDTDSYTPQRVEQCATGETFLVYNFTDGDLFEREVDGLGNFGLRFQALGITPATAAFVGASAGFTESFICGERFDAEESEAVEVIG